jgi:hypothetical protein
MKKVGLKETELARKIKDKRPDRAQQLGSHNLHPVKAVQCDGVRRNGLPVDLISRCLGALFGMSVQSADDVK